ncbi:hypothetical protein K4F52_009528 [Lecanicillium sp. MT-2017a]|nr:hypothetical protein K4F52_009528 [Lecanicillium sp. MT-2017a]
MKLTASLVALAAAALPQLASADTMTMTMSGNSTGKGPDKDGKYWINGGDGGLRAAFIRYGASVSNLMVKDQYGLERDVVAGFDNATYYEEDRQHPHFGGVPGRYANRIKNSTFEIDGKKYNVKPNENPTEDNPDGVNTLHGGPDGWDWRNFTVVAHTDSSITFMLVDPDGKEGFPGEVVSYITYTLEGMDWHIKMIAMATTKKTPIMLSSHTYWNLDGFANNETNTALNHTLWLPYSGQRISVDNILIPNGDIVVNKNGSVNDWWSKPKQLGEDIEKDELKGNCGFNCTGYDNCYLVNREQLGSYNWRTEGPVAQLASNWSGITLDVYSDQPAFQIYSCNGQNGSLALKTTQGIHNDTDFPRTIPQYGCVVMEVEDYIDGINNPEWMRNDKQIYGPGDDPYVLQATYSFSVKGQKKKDNEMDEDDG